jgi:hypothetical protein
MGTDLLVPKFSTSRRRRMPTERKKDVTLLPFTSFLPFEACRRRNATEALAAKEVWKEMGNAVHPDLKMP